MPYVTLWAKSALNLAESILKYSGIFVFFLFILNFEINRRIFKKRREEKRREKKAREGKGDRGRERRGREGREEGREGE